MSSYSEKRRGKVKARCFEKLPPQLGYILIVTEGTETEVNYFDGIKEMLDKNMKRKFVIKPVGVGKTTTNLIKEAIKIKNRNPNATETWVVLDYDNKKDFDDSIKFGESREFQIAWSNPCFEVWLIMYLSNSEQKYSNSQQCKNIMNKYFNKNLNKKYEENNERLFNDMKKIGSLKNALNTAKKRDLEYSEKIKCNCIKPSQCNNNTKVYKLMERIMKVLSKHNIYIEK